MGLGETSINLNLQFRMMCDDENLLFFLLLNLHASAKSGTNEMHSFIWVN